MRPAKTPISLGIRPVWSESSLSAWRKLGSLATNWTHSEDSDRTWRMPRLILVFAWLTLTLLVLSCRGSFIINADQFRPTCCFRSNIVYEWIYRLILDDGMFTITKKSHVLYARPYTQGCLSDYPLPYGDSNYRIELFDLLSTKEPIRLLKNRQFRDTECVLWVLFSLAVLWYELYELTKELNSFLPFRFYLVF